MPTVAQPQIFNLPDESSSYQAAGQGTGMLLAALLNYYRQKGVPGLGGGGVEYTSPTGQATTISPAERVAGAPQQRLTDLVRQQAAMTPGARVSYKSLPFLPQPPVNLDQLTQQYAAQKAPLELQKLKADIQLQQQLPELYKMMMGGGLTQLLPQLQQEAETGDEEAVQTLRYLRSKGLL
mgnify:CR=1 FL=1